MSVCVCVHRTTVINWQTRWSPQALTVVSTRKLEKLALNSGITRRSVKNDAKCVKKAHHRRHNASDKSCVPVSVAQQDVHDSGGELNLRHLYC